MRLALLYFAPRAATVKALEESYVWVIDRRTFKSTLEKSADDIVKAGTLGSRPARWQGVHQIPGQGA